MAQDTRDTSTGMGRINIDRVFHHAAIGQPCGGGRGCGPANNSPTGVLCNYEKLGIRGNRKSAFVGTCSSKVALPVAALQSQEQRPTAHSNYLTDRGPEPWVVAPAVVVFPFTSLEYGVAPAVGWCRRRRWPRSSRAGPRRCKRSARRRSLFCCAWMGLPFLSYTQVSVLAPVTACVSRFTGS